MAGPIKVDSHGHLYRTSEQALEDKEIYEIIEWTSGDLAPSDEQLAQLIKDVGPHRVMMGSDLPWYGLCQSKLD